MEAGPEIRNGQHRIGTLTPPENIQGNVHLAGEPLGL